MRAITPNKPLVRQAQIAGITLTMVSYVYSNASTNTPECRPIHNG